MIPVRDLQEKFLQLAVGIIVAFLLGGFAIVFVLLRRSEHITRTIAMPLFADIVGFTKFSAHLPPSDIVHFLERLFTSFDHIMNRFGIEKIKTIGDAYMAVAGVPIACPDHAQRVAKAALAMMDALNSAELSHKLTMRIGIHSGPAIAGVIGQEKFLYDLWGDTVNIASRLESHSLPGWIQISPETMSLLGDEYVIEKRGTTDLRGRGNTTAYWLLADRHQAKKTA